ncbi:MAG: 3-phosphoshikimate 1-carboxyvinyltransferase [Bacteroidetes bacterium]|nr:3-phosphoshikimate 1-carboxyvinyltransferase [Bacteroidota bacterium]
MIYRVIFRGSSVKANIRLPGSKSIANRLLLIRELAPTPFAITGLPDCEDTRIMESLLLLIRDSVPGDGSGIRLDCGHAGTVFRFLTAYLSNIPGQWMLTGTDRMKQRPVGALTDALRNLGADITYTGMEGFPPLLIRGKRLTGNETTLSAGISSQYISALLMLGPTLGSGLHLHLTGEQVSQPYVDMTIGLMKQQGIQIDGTGDNYLINNQAYTTMPQEVEADWSAAAFWYEIASMVEEADILLVGLREASFQGDSQLALFYQWLGVETIYEEDGVRLKHKPFPTEFPEFDLRHHPDLMPAMAVSMAVNQQQGVLKGLRNLRIKESDRISSVTDGLINCGFEVTIESDSLVINNKRNEEDKLPVVDPMEDHRIAMAFAPIAIKKGEIFIKNPSVVTKSYPRFWNDLLSAGFEIEKVTSGQSQDDVCKV